MFDNGDARYILIDMVKKITIEDLAVMVKHGFDTMATKEDLMQFATKDDLRDLEQRMATKEDLAHLRAEMRDGFFAVSRRLDLIHEDISDLPDMREELKDHDERLIQQVERKVRVAK